jgi:large subunit ribosomal protein L13
MNKTYCAKPSQVQRKWYIVNAENKILGRVATKVARILIGKHKPMYTPHLDTGDYVVIVNCAKVRVTGNKLKEKIYDRYSGYPSGRKTTTLDAMMKTKPTTVLREAVRRMLPSSPLGRKMLRKLKLYADQNHPFQAKELIKLETT